MKAASQPHHGGAALLLTLIFVVVIATVVVSLFAVSRQEVVLSGSVTAVARADLGEAAALAEVVAKLRALTANDRYLVTVARGSSPGSTAARYTFVSTPDQGGVTHAPLFAGGEERRVPLPDFDAVETTELADLSLTAPVVVFAGATRKDAVELPSLTGLGPSGDPVLEEQRPVLGFVELPSPGNSPWRTRYSYWVEDLEGYPNLDIVAAVAGDGAFARYGHGAHDSRSWVEALPLSGGRGPRFQFPRSLRNQRRFGQVAPGLSPREIALQTWPTAAFAEEGHPYHVAASFARDRNAFAGGPHRRVGEVVPESSRFSGGLSAYWKVPTVPFGFGYPDEGLPRHNLNTFVTRRDLGGLVEVLARNLPRFDERKGGFPAEMDYLASLAANAIDYADGDSRPALPSNTHNAGERVFRGVDSYCPVNEFFVKFTYEGYEEAGSQWRIVFRATPYAEFWNPCNETADLPEVRLRFRFIEPFRFLTNTRKFRIEETHLVSDGAFQNPATISVEPNGYHVHRFDDLVWKVPVDRAPELAFPIVQDLRANFLTASGTEKSSPVATRCQYELWLGGDRVDTCGRPEPDENPDTPSYGFFFPRHQPIMAPGDFIMRMTAANLSSTSHGFNAGFGSHLGDPWMTHYSRSTGEEATYVNKGSPGFRNFDHKQTEKAASLGRGDWFKDQTRVRDWPDGGYDTATGTSAPHRDGEAPDAFNRPPTEGEKAMAPWRISNEGRFYSVTELGHLHDPVMWVPGPAPVPAKEGSLLTKQQYQRFEATDNPLLAGKSLRETWLRSLPEDARPAKMWGGGNTLRIGRAEHARFDQPGLRASQWLDLLHTGCSGTNLGADGVDEELLYLHHDPRDHQPPPSAPDRVAAATQPSSLLYHPELNAQGRYALIHGHLNLNSAPTRFEFETLLRGPFSAGDLHMKTERFDTPEYERDGESGLLRSGLREEAIPLIAEGLMRARPFHGPSHLARVLSELIERHDALPEHCNDAEAEETFARLFNTTSLSSRHFRIYTCAEVYHRDTGEVVGRRRRVHEVFFRPIHDEGGELVRVTAEILSSRER